MRKRRQLRRLPQSRAATMCILTPNCSTLYLWVLFLALFRASDCFTHLPPPTSTWGASHTISSRITVPSAAAKKEENDPIDRISNDNNRKNHQRLEGEKLADNKRMASFSEKNKQQAISALSEPQPKKTKKGGRASIKRSKNQNQSQNNSASSLLPTNGSDKRTSKKKRKSKHKRKSTFKQSSETATKESSFSSLLPPPLPSLKQNESDSLSSGLSSWEEFLGRSDSVTTRSTRDGKRQPPRDKLPSKQKQGTQQGDMSTDENLQLPSISDLFPNVSTKKESSTTSSNKPQSSSSSSRSSAQSLDGVLPVSELFYRSSQAITGDEKESPSSSNKDKDADEGDDEELPFSAEQSDELTTNGNKVKIRRNNAAAQTTASKSQKSKRSRANKRNRGRKLVRRGMEMFLGGTPINADPPQRSVELTYKFDPNNPYSWASAITLNTRDFGPLLHTGSAESVTRVELGLFCENFVAAAIKWDVCPKDLRDIVKSWSLQQESPSDSKLFAMVDSPTNMLTSIDVEFVNGDFSNNLEASLREQVASDEADTILSMLRDIHEDNESETDEGEIETIKPSELTKKSRKNKKKGRKGRGKMNAQNLEAKGFGKKPEKARGRGKNNESRWRMAGFALKFLIGVTIEELESGDPSDAPGSVMRGIMKRGISTFLGPKLDGLMVRIETMKLEESEDGGTIVTLDFSLDGKGNASEADMEKLAGSIDSALCQSIDDGAFALALAAAAKEETAWSSTIRDRVVEEFLLEDDDVHAPWDEAEANGRVNGDAKPKAPSIRNGDSESTLNGGRNYAEDDIFGHEGVFFDYSESNAANAPFKGQLGPILVDAVTAKAAERPPRVISIGDVHGCVDELQDLLRLCDYRPGDQIVFLGDLVSKGPDSISVVQMAREIGAIAVRGNHDFEVIRWHQAIKAGVDAPVVGSEHFHIASCLSLADMRWMHCQPWYMASKELGALFVHAGFVSGIRLSKQNPRLMMNMRSILPDGTVTSKFFNNWPWARLWDGPQTVLFGHDADRGLQQYEHAIGLDTGCVYGGRLTACILPEKRLVSVSARREYFKYRRKHYD